ncbi:Uncharacterised protein, partial [Mycoplasma putrefaciens]
MLLLMSVGKDLSNTVLITPQIIAAGKALINKNSGNLEISILKILHPKSW